MVYSSLQEIKHQHNIAIIINVATPLLSTLALHSALKYAKMPVLVVNSPIDDQALNSPDYKYLLKLHDEYNFDLIELPLKKHGYILDEIFMNINADNILLIDSDLEIIDTYAIDYMLKYIEYPWVFGSGFIQGPRGLGGDSPMVKKNGYLVERMWIPLTILDVKKVKEAIRREKSFIAKYVFNDFPIIPTISKMLFYSYKFRLFKKNRVKHKYKFKFLNLFKQKFGDYSPSFIHYDTGADIYQDLKYTQDYSFIGFTESLVN